LSIKQLKIDKFGILAFLIIVSGTLLRILLIASGWPHSNADEGTMGIMAMHIAFKGERPIFFYGQYYMGTLEAYAGAALFRLFGVSVFSLRLGLVFLFALFLTCMYLLTSLLYTRKLALITIILLSLGSSIMLDTELVAIGGYPELLLFGALSMLLASWLALTYDQNASARRRLLRLLAYGFWGIVGGLGFWNEFLMIAFIMISGFLLILFCWSELLEGAVLCIALGLIIGAFPLIIYNLHPVPGQSTLVVLKYLHSNGSLQLAQLSAHDPIPFGPQLRASLLTSLPATTGGMPFCFGSYTHFRLTGYLGAEKFPCPIIHGDLRLAVLALAWSLGFMMLWTWAVYLALKRLWQLCVRTPARLRSPTEKQVIAKHFARLVLLCTAVITLYFFISSPMAVAFPANGRYLIGLLIVTPALLAPVWGLSNDNNELDLDVSAHNHHMKRAFFTSPGQHSTIKKVLGRGLLLLISIAFLVGTIGVFFEIATVQTNNHQQDALIQDLLHIKATHIYTDYWTCDSIALQSKEHIMCGVLDNTLQPHNNRYLPYLSVVKADQNSAYVFPSGADQIPAVAKKVALSAGRYQRLVFDGYIIYQPLRASTHLFR
jgi:hypothetical protein